MKHASTMPSMLRIQKQDRVTSPLCNHSNIKMLVQISFSYRCSAADDQKAEVKSFPRIMAQSLLLIIEKKQEIASKMTLAI